MKIDYTNEELRILDEIRNELILNLFENSERGYRILIALKRAFELGIFHKHSPSKSQSQNGGKI